MEDNIPVKILELGEGEVMVIVNARGPSTRLREGQLARSQLSGSIVVGRAAAEQLRTASPPAYRREGQHWRVSFDGTVVSLQDTVGVRHIARLLAAPGRRFRCDELLALEAGEPRPPCVHAGELVADARAMRAYRGQLEWLERDLAAARALGDGERASLLQQEHERLGALLRAAAGKGGRSRKFVDELERARQAVSAAIRRTMKVLKSAHPSLWRHLYKHLQTGYFCQYEPSPAVTWVTA